MAAITLACTAAGIEKLHGQLLARLSDNLEHACSIDVPPKFRSTSKPRPWARASAGKVVVFYLWDEETGIVPANTARPDLPVVQLREEDGNASELAWVAWVEKWESDRKQDKFLLRSAQFVFFWGRFTTVEEQLFRAEWDHHGSDRAAHPHWHVDWPVQAIHYASGLHLGMGGWRFADETPECWQTFADSEDALIDWAAKTLGYARQQLRDFPLKHV